MSLSTRFKNLAIRLYWHYTPGSQRVAAGFGVALLLLVLLSIVSAQNVKQLLQETSQMNQAYADLALLTEVSMDLLDSESARRGYFLFKDSEELERYHLAVQNLSLKLEKLRPLSNSQPLEPLIQERLDLFQQSIVEFEQRQVEFSTQHPLIIRTQQNRQTLRQLLTTLTAQEKQRVQGLRLAAQQTLRSRTLIEIFGTVLTFLILLGVYIILRHQRLRRERAEARQRYLAHRTELSEMKLEFFSMVSHEFRTPLSLITGSAQLLKDTLKPIVEPSKLKNLNRIQASARRMTQQLNDLLLLARADAGKMEFNPTSLEMQTFCLNLVEAFQTFGEHQRLIRFTQRGQSAHVMVDEKLVYSILSNLLSNALKYSEPKSAVDFLMICDPHLVTFQIQDQGIGIPPEDQQEIYSLFNRGGNVKNTFGSGLGLTVVKRCVDLHQGSISVESKVGVGTTVIVKLPNLGYLK